MYKTAVSFYNSNLPTVNIYYRTWSCSLFCTRNHSFHLNECTHKLCNLHYICQYKSFLKSHVTEGPSHLSRLINFCSLFISTSVLIPVIIINRSAKVKDASDLIQGWEVLTVKFSVYTREDVSGAGYTKERFSRVWGWTYGTPEGNHCRWYVYMLIRSDGMFICYLGQMVCLYVI